MFTVPRDLLLADNTIRIKLLNNAVDAVAVQALSLRAGTRLKMMGDTAGSDEANPTEWTRNVGAAMDLGIQVL